MGLIDPFTGDGWNMDETGTLVQTRNSDGTLTEAGRKHLNNIIVDLDLIRTIRELFPEEKDVVRKIREINTEERMREQYDVANQQGKFLDYIKRIISYIKR